MPSIVLGVRDTAGNQTYSAPCAQDTYIPVREIESKP